MKSVINKFIGVLTIVLLVVSSCHKDDSQEQKDQEMRILTDYILTNNITVQPTADGLYYIPSVIGTGDSLLINNWIELSYTGRLLSSNDIVYTSDKQTAIDNNIFVSGIYYGPVRLVIGNISIEGLNKGVSMMREGGKARLIFPSDLGFGGQSNGGIPAYSSLIFDVELNKYIPDIESYEHELLMNYLEANEISTDSTSTGIYIKTTIEGLGDLPDTGDKVTVTYSGELLNGSSFGSGSYTITIGAGQVIPGFESGIKLIKKGGSATIVIPYYYAYGEYGRLDSNYRTVIPPFATLVFELTVTNITQ